MPEFSIIIPVYNAEKTLYRCLDSICAQTYGDFEVHMVENDSRDSSNAICREYTVKDSRFILHTCEENCGPSGARNIGINNAKGNVITFIDSDDFIEPDYLETLYKGFETADVVFFGYNQIVDGAENASLHIPHIAEKSDYYTTLLQLHTQDSFGYTWIKAFRADVIGEHRFSQQLNLLEDEVFACEILFVPRKVNVIPKAVYNYVTGKPGSLMGRTHPDYCRKVDMAFKAWEALLADYDKKEEALMQMANSHVNKCMYYCYERDVDIKDFCNQLADCTFFAVSMADNTFVECVKQKNYAKLFRMKALYLLKNKIATFVKR